MIDIVTTIMKVIQRAKMDDKRRLDILEWATDLKMKVLNGVDSRIQFHAFLAKV
jgi:hypothetical protein